MADHLAIRIQDVAKSFGPVRANRAASLEVRAGEIHALVGENGAGKSTLMRILAGLYAPDAGTLEVDGRDVTGWDTNAAIAAGVGYSETAFGVKYLNKVRCIPEDRFLAQRVIFDRYAPSTAMRRLMRAVKSGEVVSIVAASTEGSDMIKAPVFGGRLPVAVGAPRLAGLTGAPVLPDALVAFDCRIVDRHEVGTHDVLICAVEALAGINAAEGLLYAGRHYRVLPRRLTPAD